MYILFSRGVPLEPLELFQTSRLASHAMSSLHHQEPPRDFARSNTSVLALQAEEPMLTLLALLAPELCCTSQAEKPMLTLLVSRTSPTSRGTNVDLACLRVALYT